MEHGSTSAELHGQDSFLAKRVDPEKRRHQRRVMYSLMTDEQRDALLRNNRQYKPCRQETRTLEDHDDDVPMTDGAQTPTGIISHIIPFCMCLGSPFNGWCLPIIVYLMHIQRTQTVVMNPILQSFLNQTNMKRGSKVKIA
jgi:hypothetical protein